MMPWEAQLFRAGAGCPSCEGRAPEGSNAEKILERHARDVMLSGAVDDPGPWSIYHETLGAHDEGLNTKRPEWKRPEDPIVWSCDGCEAVVRQSLDVAKPSVVRTESGRFRGINGLYWEDESRYSDQDEFEKALHETLDAGLKAPDSRLIDGKPYCPHCAERCGECGLLTFEHELQLPDGKYGKGDAICQDCMAKIPTCAYCGSQLGDDEEIDDEGYGPCCHEDSEEDDEEEGADDVEG